MAAGDTTVDTGGEFIFAAGNRRIDGGGVAVQGIYESHTARA